MIIIIEITDTNIEIGLGTNTNMTTDKITTCPRRDIIPIDRTIGGETAIDKTIEIDKILEGMTLDKETGVKVEIGLDIIVMTVPEVETGL